MSNSLCRTNAPQKNPRSEATPRQPRQLPGVRRYTAKPVFPPRDRRALVELCGTRWEFTMGALCLVTLADDEGAEGARCKAQ